MSETFIAILVNSGPIGAILLVIWYQINGRLDRQDSSMKEMSDQHKIYEKRADKQDRKVAAIEATLEHIDENFVKANGH